MATKTIINKAKAQANTATATKLLSLTSQFVNKHWQRANTPALVQKRFLSANQRLLNSQYNHDAKGYIGDEQLGRWCPKDYDEIPCAACKISSGSLNNLPFSYDSLTKSFYVFGVKPGRTVKQFTKEYKLHQFDTYTLVYITLRRSLVCGYPQSYNVHSVVDYGRIPMVVKLNEKKNDFTDINKLQFRDVFDVDKRFADNFNFKLDQRFNLLQALGTAEWVVMDGDTRMNTVGAWAIVKTGKTGKSHSSEVLQLVNPRLFGLSYSNMLDSYL